MRLVQIVACWPSRWRSPSAPASESSDANGLVERAEAGVSIKVPATWKLDAD